MEYLYEFQKLADKNKSEKINSSNIAVIYTRVSSREQAENNASLETQRKYCLQYAEKNNLEVAAYFGGTYESAKSDERKEFQKMLTYVRRNKKIGTILVYSYDRFSRTGPNGAYLSEQLLNNGIKILSVTQNVDPLTASGFFQQNIFFAFSHFDNVLRKDKCVTGMRERLKEGYWVFSPPIGYSNLNKGTTADKHKLVINDNGKLLKKAFYWKRTRKYSDYEILLKLDQLGLKLNPKYFTRIITNPFYCGIIITKMLPGEVIEGKHPPLISKKLFLEVENIINNSSKNLLPTINKEVEELPLKVFMKCETTGCPFTGYIVHKKGIYYYKARDKGVKHNINAKFANNLFVNELKKYELDKKYFVPFREIVKYIVQETIEIKDDQKKALRKRSSELKKKIEDIEERFVMGEINKELFNKYNQKFKAELDEINQKIEGAKIQSSNLEKTINKTLKISRNLSETWINSTYDNKRKLQYLIFPDGIYLNKENRRLRTSRVNSLFNIIPSFSETCINKKSGLFTLQNKKSTLVDPAGFEPATP
jgi:site-specific DNA recombinase